MTVIHYPAKRRPLSSLPRNGRCKSGFLFLCELGTRRGQLTDREERFGVMVGDLLVLIRSNRSHLLQLAERLDLGGLVVVAVVGADSNIILSRIPENIIHVVVRLAGNILPVFLHRVLRQFLSLGRPAALQIFYYVRYPLGGGLGPVEPELGK